MDPPLRNSESKKRTKYEEARSLVKVKVKESEDKN